MSLHQEDFAMRIRSHLAARVPLDMTPMIDIVFQLLIFFILSLQITALEGNLDVSLPFAAWPRAPTVVTPPLIVVLTAGERGTLREVIFNDSRLANLEELHTRVKKLVAADPLLTETGSAVLRCDEDLAYEHTVAAITAVSGAKQADGSIQPLIPQVSFRAGN